MNVKLVVVQGKAQGKEIALPVGEFLIGRGAECQLRPNNELVSRVHCMFARESDSVRLRDLGSSNGTRVNGQRINGDVVIQNGDLIQVGALGFQVVMDREAAPASASPGSVGVAASDLPTAPVPEHPAQDLPGTRDASESNIGQWLLSESTPRAPGTESSTYADDTQQMQMVDQDTTIDFIPTAPEQEAAKESEEKVVETEGGSKIKLSAAKYKIEKTREDTSRAAADILRRLIGRRPER